MSQLHHAYQKENYGMMNLIITVLILIPQSNLAFRENVMLTVMMTIMKQVIWRRFNTRMSSQEYGCLYFISKRSGLGMKARWGLKA